MIKTVFFDLDNTLYDFDLFHEVGMNAVLGYIKEHLGMKKKDARALIDTCTKGLYERLGENSSAPHNRLIRFQTMLEAGSFPIFPHAKAMAEIYWKSMIEASVPYDGIIEFLTEIKAAGLKVGIATNMTSYVQFIKLDHLGVSPYVDYVITSELCGYEKPDPHFFAYCLETADCLSSECVMIGDSVEYDIKGAQAVGIRGILYTRGKEAKKSDKAISDMTLKNYADADLDTLFK